MTLRYEVIVMYLRINFVIPMIAKYVTSNVGR